MKHLETSTIHETAQRFKIAASAISGWNKLLKEARDLKPIPVIRKAMKIDYVKLREYIEKYPDKYLREIAEIFKVSLRGIDYALKMKRGERTIQKKYQNIIRKT